MRTTMRSGSRLRNGFGRIAHRDRIGDEPSQYMRGTVGRCDRRPGGNDRRYEAFDDPGEQDALAAAEMRRTGQFEDQPVGRVGGERRVATRKP